MMRNEELQQREARLALLRRSLEMLTSGELRLVRGGGIETTAEAVEAVGREIAALEATVRRLRAEADGSTRRVAVPAITPAMAFALAC